KRRKPAQFSATATARTPPGLSTFRVERRTRQEDSPPRICEPKLLVIRAWNPCADAAARSDSPALTTPSPPEPASPTTRSSIILVPRTPGLQELQHARGLPEPMQGAGLRGACDRPRAPAGPTRRPCAADAVHARTLRLSPIAGALLRASTGVPLVRGAPAQEFRRRQPGASADLSGGPPGFRRSAARAELSVPEGEEERG